MIIITGSDTGIGYECALEMAKLEPKAIIMACRDEKRADAAVKRIRDQGFNNIEFI